MLVLEIVLVFIGLIAVGISFRLSDYHSGNAAGMPGGLAPHGKLPYEELEQEWEQLQEKIEQYKEETMQAASGELSRLSNDKLLGMDEYSGQVLERIQKNHEEVVFLYDMLREKETEIKDLVHHVDSVKAQIHDETAQEYQKMMEALKLLQERRRSIDEASASLPSGSGKKPPSPDLRAASARTAPAGRKQMPIEATQAKHLAESAGEQGLTETKKAAAPRGQRAAAPQKKRQEENHNQEIIALYQKGHSVLEISKLLSLGQGEVKFVIDLFENR